MWPSWIKISAEAKEDCGSRHKGYAVECGVNVTVLILCLALCEVLGGHGQVEINTKPKY